MAPVQTFSSSPIVAAKAPTATTHSPTTSKTVPATATAAPSSSSSYSSPSHGQTPPAQPAARPSIPAATSSASFSPRGATGHAAAMLPTPTQQLISDSNSPPAPQPGAVPIPPGAATAAAASTSSTLPPPPKSGETLGGEHTGAAAAQPPRALPAQLSYPPPTASHTSLRGTSAAVPSPYEVGGVGGGGGGGGSVQLLPGINRATDLSHPPGYQQDAQAAEFSSGQRAAHEAYVAQHSNRLTSGLVMGMGLGAGGGGGGGEAGAGDAEGTTIWNTAKKWASAAGDTLAAAEGEVWKAVNKDHK